MPENVNTSALSLNGSDSNITNDNRQTMIKVDHVSMVFNMASEQLNSLKEYAIKIARRELFFEGFTALEDVSFEVKKGDVFGIIGTNGSGKSTMLKIIAGVLEPSSGSCQINGNIAPLIELGAGFDTELSARENIYLNGALLGYSKVFINEHFDEIVDFAEIEKFLDMPLKNYSSGMVARIAFAIATVIIPEILVVDEVLSVGDFMFQKKCEDRINELIEKHGVTVLIVSHSNTQIQRLCNKAIWIEKGHVRMQGNASDVCRIYGALGGRTGSHKAELRVFDALNDLCLSPIPDSLLTRIQGENADSINTRVALRGMRGNRPDTIIIASGTTHINAIMGNSLGGALNAPVVSTKPEELSEAVEHLLFNYKPSCIITIDCGKNARKAFSTLDSLPWNPDVVTFENEGSVFDMSLSIFQFGHRQRLWGNKAAFIRFGSNPQSLVASPYLYHAKCPVIVAFDEDNIDCQRLASTLTKASIDSLVSFGADPVKDFDEQLINYGIVTERISGSNTFESCLAISKWVFEKFSANGHTSNELCVASLSLAQWPELLSCGCYSAHYPTVLLLEDSTDLDSIASCLDFVRKRKETIHTIVSIGNQLGLDDTELEMLCSELNYR